MLGYPINMSPPPRAFLAWRRRLQRAGIGLVAYNNGGNPYATAPIPHNTHAFERRIVERLGRLFAFPADDLWGFLSHSGTDSNLHGLYIGRTLLQSRTGRQPKCYLTREAHYSIQILSDLLGLEAVFVDTWADGGMSPDDLARKVATYRDHPALVVATVGTTFKGAVDRLEPIREVLAGQPHYLHLDAALFGGYLPHTPYAGLVGQQPQRYDSIAISCHKFFGFHSPAGLFLTTRTVFDEFNHHFSRIHSPEYIGHVPGTITCSRDAVKPAEFCFYTTPQALARQAKDAHRILMDTAYLLERMRRRCPHLQPRRAHPASNIVYFRRPSAWIVKKYILATMNDQAHVVVMPHVNRAMLDAFLADLERES